MPNKTLAFKGERCAGGKKSKERVTVLIGSNASGTEKLSLFVIGKSAKPRCFKNAKLPVKYEANKKAWMTVIILRKAWDDVTPTTISNCFRKAGFTFGNQEEVQAEEVEDADLQEY
ncbi:hypothetical protein ZOSMA_13167G00010, partial [Zostera marina]